MVFDFSHQSLLKVIHVCIKHPRLNVKSKMAPMQSEYNVEVVADGGVGVLSLIPNE